MHLYPEVRAAVAYLGHLVQNQHASAVGTPEALRPFNDRLSLGLQQRIQRSWYPENPVKGNALRAIHWGTDMGYKDLDEVLMNALKVLPGELARFTAHAPNAFRLLPISFTLWIDPGCVSVSTYSRSTNGAWPGWDSAEADEQLTVLWPTPMYLRSPKNAIPKTSQETSPFEVSARKPATSLAIDYSSVGDTSSLRTPGLSRPWQVTQALSNEKSSPSADYRSSSSICAARVLPARSRQSTSRSPVRACSDNSYEGTYTFHDNGNVVVLGSDVKLGRPAPPSSDVRGCKPPSPVWPHSRPQTRVMPAWDNASRLTSEGPAASHYRLPAMRSVSYPLFSYYAYPVPNYTLPSLPR